MNFARPGWLPFEAAVTAGYTRLRPIIMTAFAMIIGMLPMALGLGEGGEQNAPLARAVIGGLSIATFATLFFVPLMFTADPRKKFQHDHDPGGRMTQQTETVVTEQKQKTSSGIAVRVAGAVALIAALVAVGHDSPAGTAA